MKISEYNQMMAYLTKKAPLTKEQSVKLESKLKAEETKRINTKRKEYGLKPNQRQETMSERIERIQYQYDGIGNKPKHLDNPNIVEFEDLKPIQKIKKEIVPVNIDISGINAEINKYEKATQISRPDFKLRKDDELEGIETILGIKA